MSREAKSQFSDSLTFERATASNLYATAEPVDPKITGMCLRDQIAPYTEIPGETVSGTESVCQLSERCTYANDKISGVSGICLKATVGVAKPSK